MTIYRNFAWNDTTTIPLKKKCTSQPESIPNLYSNNFLFVDLDNLVKFVLDALNAKAYDDDSQIAVIKSAKFYTLGEPYTKIILRKLSDSDYEDFDFQ